MLEQTGRKITEQGINWIMISLKFWNEIFYRYYSSPQLIKMTFAFSKLGHTIKNTENLRKTKRSISCHKYKLNLSNEHLNIMFKK